MNDYQKRMNEIKLDENAKQRLFSRVQNEWDYSREYRIKFERMRTANILLSVFLTVLCVTNVAMATLMPEKVDTVLYDDGVNYYRVGETFSCYDCDQKKIDWHDADGSLFNGSFTWNGIYVAKSIQKGDTVYTSDKDYFLIIKETLDLDEYSIKYNNFLSFLNAFGSYEIVNGVNDTGDKWLSCEGESKGEDRNSLNEEVTRAISCDLAITEPPRPARGVAYLCMDITKDMYEYLYFNTVVKTEGIEGIKRVGVPQSIDNKNITTTEEAIERYESNQRELMRGYNMYLEQQKEREEWKTKYPEKYQEYLDYIESRWWWHKGEYDQADYFHKPNYVREITFCPSNLMNHIYIDNGKRYKKQLDFYAYYEDIEYFDTFVI